MTLPIPQSALIFNNFIDYNDLENGSLLNGKLEENDINLFFILSDFYYAFSKNNLNEDDYFMNDKIELKDFLGTSEVNNTKFKNFPETVSYDTGAGKGTIKSQYSLYNQGFFTLGKLDSLFGLDGIEKKVLPNVKDLGSTSKVAIKNIKKQKEKVKFTLLALMSNKNDVSVSKNNPSQSRKLIEINEITYAYLDTLFTLSEEENSIPYLANVLPELALPGI